MRWASGLSVLIAMAAACGGPSRPEEAAGSAGAPDGGSVADGGMDPGADAGTPADCAGLLPAAPGTAFSFDVLQADSGQSCDLAAIDGEGVVAAAAHTGTSPTWYEFAPDYGGGSGSFGSPVAIPQPSGFLGLWGAGSNLDVAHFTQDGELENPVPLGGGAALLAPAFADGAISLSAGPGSLTVRKHGADATALGTATIQGAWVPLAAAEDAGGLVLALASDGGGGVSGFWVNLASGTAGQPFTAGAGSAAFARPLQGGGVAVRIDGRWAGIVRPGQSTPQEPPAWLGDAADFALARGGKAYALLPGSGNTVGIASLQGSFCGTVAFPGVSAISLGSDGTVVGATGTRGCTKYVWRGALR